MKIAFISQSRKVLQPPNNDKELLIPTDQEVV